MRRTARLFAAAGIVAVVAGAPLSGAAAQTFSGAGARASGDWPTYLNNVARTGYNSAETAVTPATAPDLTQLWADTAGGPVSAEPIQVNGVVYYGSWDGHEYAVNAGTGTRLWSAFLGQTTDTKCSPPTMGVASTATVATITVNGTPTQVLFVACGDNNVYALNASTGAVIWKTPLDIQPNRFLFSSPLLYNGSIYEGMGSCGNGQVRGGIAQLNAATGTVQHILYTAPSGCEGANVWGSPTVDTATGDIYFATGSGGSCGSPEPLSVSVVETGSSLNVLSSWQLPARQQPTNDSDFGSTPTLFTARIGGVVRQMVGVQNKNGIYYAFARSAISHGPLWHKRMAVGGDCPQCGKTDISPSAWDGHHLFVGGEQTTIKGATCAGSIRELRPSTGKAVWARCLGGPVLGAVTAVRGVAFVGAGNTAYAVRTRTGAILWHHQDTASGSNFWGAPTISRGHVYFGNQDDNLYAFGT
jgi:outer membrane protein assembly factor BamB